MGAPWRSVADGDEAAVIAKQSFARAESALHGGHFDVGKQDAARTRWVARAGGSCTSWPCSNAAAASGPVCWNRYRGSHIVPCHVMR